MMKKKSGWIALLALLLCLVLGLTACGTAVSVTGVSINENGELIVVMSDGSLHNAGKVTGTDGEQGSQGTQGAQGAQGEQGEQGIQGEKGQDGTKITIGENGNWYLDGVDSGVAATGKAGAAGEAGTVISIGENGNWYLDGVDSGVAATGSGDISSVSLIAAVAAVKNAVVEILTTTSSSYGALSAGAGSGVIIHADGTIVTNHHVINGADTIYVRLTNGNVYEASLVGSDEVNDIAVIEIEPEETLTVAGFAADSNVALGQEVFVIGNPLGELGGTVTSGIISALEREIVVDGITMKLLQTDTAINSGNSGGGLFNLNGELIGVVNAKYAATGVEGLGFAIPAETAKETVDDLIEFGYIPGRSDLGVTLVDANVVMNYQYTTMPRVTAVHDSDSALQLNDYIYQVNGTVVTSVSQLKSIIRELAIGDTVTLRIYRNNGWHDVSVTLVEYTGW